MNENSDPNEVVVFPSWEQMKELLKEGVWLVMYYAPWCSPCRMADLVFRRLAEEPDMVGVRFAIVNVDDAGLNKETSDRVRSIPCFELWIDGEYTGERYIGTQDLKYQLTLLIVENVPS